MKLNPITSFAMSALTINLAGALMSVILIAPASAQQPAAPPVPDPMVQINFCQKQLSATQNQRNSATDLWAQCVADRDLINDELTKIRAEATDLKRKAEEETKAKAKLSADLANSQAENADLKKKLAAVPPVPAQ